MRRVIGLFAATAVVGTGLLVGSAGAVTSAAKPLGVKQITLDLVDSSRPTPANGTYPGAPNRELKTVVSIPTRGGKPLRGPLPLIVFATGYGGTATNYAPLYDHWVRAGYVVAAPTFPLSSDNAPGGTSPIDLDSQPGDVSFVLDQVLEQSASGKKPLKGLVDADRVGLAGKSLGAITSLDVGYVPQLQDKRFKAVVAMTGVAGSAADFTTIHTPLLLVHGDADTDLPISGSQQTYARAGSPKFFVTLFGQTHGSAFGGGSKPAEKVVERTTLDFLDLYVRGEKSALRRLEKDGNTKSVSSLQASP